LAGIYKIHRFFKDALFIFYVLLPLIALINISSRDYKLFPKNRNPGNVPLNCRKKIDEGNEA
jgi:hypothetical protein